MIIIKQTNTAVVSTKAEAGSDAREKGEKEY